MVAQLRYRGNADSYKPIEATGGTIVQAMINNVLHNVHYFTKTGLNTFNVIFPGSKDRIIKYLVLAGGASGGDSDNETEAGAGGGAGGYREGQVALTSPVSIDVFIGAGGSPPSGSGSDVGNDGQSSYISSTALSLNISSAGGGGGGNGQGNPGRNGGSGGGSNRRTTTFGLGNTPATTPPQGYNGIVGTGNIGGGGGGSSAAAPGQAGGDGRQSSISGTLSIYAIGGSGGNNMAYGFSPAEFGSGGGGAGAAGEKAADPAQRMNPGIAGRSGVVIIAYPISPKAGFDNPQVPNIVTKPTAVSNILFDTVTWPATNDNGSPILDYQWQSTDGKSGTTTSLGVTVTQEGNSPAQGYRVRARNAVGFGPWSEYS
jgi:hypothetical protein